jgi:hypothetical protein
LPPLPAGRRAACFVAANEASPCNHRCRPDGDGLIHVAFGNKAGNCCAGFSPLWIVPRGLCYHDKAVIHYSSEAHQRRYAIISMLDPATMLQRPVTQELFQFWATPVELGCKSAWQPPAGIDKGAVSIPQDPNNIIDEEAAPAATGAIAVGPCDCGGIWGWVCRALLPVLSMSKCPLTLLAPLQLRPRATGLCRASARHVQATPSLPYNGHHLCARPRRRQRPTPSNRAYQAGQPVHNTAAKPRPRSKSATPTKHKPATPVVVGSVVVGGGFGDPQQVR